MRPAYAGCAQVLKSLISTEHRVWLELTDNIAHRWFCKRKPFSVKERLILIRN